MRRDYKNPHWENILEYNNLSDFDSIWNLEAEWFEAPNKRRGGWSGVNRLELRDPSGYGTKSIFLKRQENHICRTMLHPLKGIPTFRREIKNLFKFNKLGLPTLSPIYYAERKTNSGFKSILITEELVGYKSLDEWSLIWHEQGWPCKELRSRLMRDLSAIIRKIHKCGFRHGCLYPKHIFVKFANEDLSRDQNIEIRMIDLEKTRYWPFKKVCIVKDLSALNRHSQHWRTVERLKFYKLYLQLEHLDPKAKKLWQSFAKRHVRKKRVLRPMGYTGD